MERFALIHFSPTEWRLKSNGVPSFHMDRLDCIELRDLLLHEFPLDGWAAPGEIAAIAEYASHRERRERIATAVLSGLLSNPGNEGVRSPLMDYEPDIATLSIRYADALIAELDKEA